MTERMKKATMKAVLILVELAKENKVITYGKLGEFVGYNAQNVGRILSPIQNYCIENNLPPITSLVILDDGTGKPSYNYIQRYSEYSEDMKRAFNHTWDNIIFKTGFL